MRKQTSLGTLVLVPWSLVPWIGGKMAPNSGRTPSPRTEAVANMVKKDLLVLSIEDFLPTLADPGSNAIHGAVALTDHVSSIMTNDALRPSRVAA